MSVKPVNFSRGAASIAALASAALLSACGASSNSAPIVYGTNPGSTARVYNSPADVYLARGGAAEQTAQRDLLQPVAATPPAPAAYDDQRRAGIQATPYSRPVSLTAVSQSAYENPVYADASNPAPVYVSETSPVTTPRGYQASAQQVPQQSLPAGAVRVQPGDTVYAIARRTGARPQDIIAENRLSPPYALQIGQVLYVRSAGRKIVNQTADYQPALPIPAATQPLARQSAGAHIVRQGDTLYSISRATGVSVSALAQANNLYPPYQLSVGDRLIVPGGAIAPGQRGQTLTRKVSYNAPTKPIKPASLFEWPVKGAIIGNYGAGVLGQRNDGINIAAPVGTPVRAAADGEVVYRGSELDGYGNLLLIKHDDGFVTAYAHNDVMLVRKGQKVRQGQVVAKVGQTGSAPEPQLHFEIRQNLKSVDPLAFLDR
ncbi:MAG: peptidoglycan DD-metalloendopeptidase family protein [Pseudomonadota bacterium]